MIQAAVSVTNGHRMMTQARVVRGGIEVTFADGASGVVPRDALPELGPEAHISGIELPNPYLLIVRGEKGKVAEAPWDFVRHFCDASYRPRIEQEAARGRHAIGRRLRAIREEAGLTQAGLAGDARIGRITLLRIESGEQSPRYETLIAIAKALKRPLRDLLAG